MHKTTLLIVLSIICFCSAFAQGTTHITSIRTGNTEISPESWNSVRVSGREGITFSYKADGDQSGKIIFKILLTGSASSPVVMSTEDESISFKDLKKGEYIFKVQAFLNASRAQEPQAIAFTVSDAAAKKTAEERTESEAKTDAKTGTDDMIIYVLAFICLVQAVVLVNISRRKKTSAGGNSTEPGTMDDKELRRLYTALKKDYDRLKSRRDSEKGTSEVYDSYESLKTDYEAMKENNKQLKKKVEELKSTVAALENANENLSKQKAKLLLNKRQLEELQRQKDELFAMAIHDIKNPAAAIKSYVELLESYDLNANEQQEIMQSLADTSTRIVDLAQKMSLVVAQIKPEPILNMEKGSVKTLVDAVCKRNSAYAIKKKINLINQASPNTPETKMDISQIEEVLDNLVNNAIKYSPEGSVVQIKSYFSDSKITVEVADNGVGIPEHETSRAFDKGVLLSPAPTGGEPRSGLGLWIVKNIVEEHDGRVWLKSKPGAGSTFGFELPIRK